MTHAAAQNTVPAEQANACAAHQVLDVQAPGGDGGGDQHVAHVGLEVGDGGLAVALVLAAVQRQARVPALRVRRGHSRVLVPSSRLAHSVPSHAHGLTCTWPQLKVGPNFRKHTVCQSKASYLEQVPEQRVALLLALHEDQHLTLLVPLAQYLQNWVSSVLEGSPYILQ